MSGRAFWSGVGRTFLRLAPGWDELSRGLGAICIGYTFLPPTQDDGQGLQGVQGAAQGAQGVQGVQGVHDMDFAGGRRPAGPAAGHPERLDPTVPLSEVERALWAQLDVVP